MTTAGPKPDWYFDPDGGENERYWNGVVWTDHRRSRRPTVSQPAESFSRPPRPIETHPQRTSVPPAVAAVPTESANPRRWFNRFSPQAQTWCSAALLTPTLLMYYVMIVLVRPSIEDQSQIGLAWAGFTLIYGVYLLALIAVVARDSQRLTPRSP